VGCLAGGLLLGGVAACTSADRAAQESFEVAEFEERQGNVDHARQLYQEILSRSPQSEWAHRIMAEGEALQLLHCGDLTLTDDAYLKIVECKTAALLSAACRLGGVLSGASWEEREALGRFGRFLGIAYQVADDTLDYVADQGRLGKALGKDLSEGKITLPLLHLLRTAGASDRQLVQTVVREGQASPAQLREILDLMQTYGSIVYAMDVARQHITIAQQSLDGFDPSPHRQALVAVADYVVSRDH
jgi:octaprenyl-diphosphate synthase